MIKTNKVQVFSISIILLGLFYLYHGLQFILTSKNLFPFIFFVILSIITESLSFSLNDSTYISIGFAIALASIILFHPLTSPLILFIGTLLRVDYENNKYYHILNSSFYKRLFNGCAYALSAFVASYSYKLGSNFMPNLKISSFSILGILFTISSYIIIHTVIFMILFSLIEKKSFKELLLSNAWAIKNFIGIAPLGILMAVSYINYGWFAVLLFFGPVLLARYSFKLYLDMKNVYFETIKVLSNAIDAKDHYTNGHSHRVAHYAEVIAIRMNLANNKIDTIKTASLLHDIGKIGISDEILNKSGNLTDEEFAIIKQHPLIGAKILSDVDFLKDVSIIVRHHHERYDGKGYPDGLRGEDIPIEAAILSVADAFDAMSSNRPYRNAMTFTAAANVIIKEAGKQFNPIVAKVFKDIMDENKEMLINVS